MFIALKKEFHYENTYLDMNTHNNDKYLQEFSSISKYVDDVWILDKRYIGRNTQKGPYRFNFSALAKNHIHLIKQYVLKRLLHRMAVSTIYTHTCNIKEFMRFLEKEHIDITHSELPIKTLNKFINTIQVQNIGTHTKTSKIVNLKSFFEQMQLMDLFYHFNQFDCVIERKYLNSSRLIPTETIAAIDEIYRNDSIVPLVHRVAYWMLRLIPNRVEEVLSTKIDCLNRISDTEYILSIPTFKQSGQYVKPENKNIIIKNEGMGAYLIMLIKEQQAVSEKLQDQIFQLSNKNYLFTHTKYGLVSIYEPYEVVNGRKAIVMKSPSINKILAKICDTIDVKDQQGQPYRITSHFLRHNAISDRLNHGVFRPIDIMWLTKHKSTKMITDAYFHPSNEDIAQAENQANTLITKEELKSCKVRIIQKKFEKKYQQILDNPFAYQVPGGICSDNSNCKSYMWECLQCPSFIPDINKLSYFEEQVKFWTVKMTTADLYNQYLLKENATYNLSLNTKIVEAIHQLITNGAVHND